MNTREYLPADAPFVTNALFPRLPVTDQLSTIQGSRKLLISAQGTSILGASGATSTKFEPTYRASNYYPATKGLLNFLSAPNAHLSPAGIFLSAQGGDSKFSRPGTSALPGAVLATGGDLKRRPLGIDGNRLPSVLKKALPLPPEDVRSVPHMRLNSRPNSPPVVSVGMVDGEGVPIPWSKTQGMVGLVSGSSKSLLKDFKTSSKADEVRDRMRNDFDSIEAFIEEAFNGRMLAS
jgi:hypothetical protein